MPRRPPLCHVCYGWLRRYPHRGCIFFLGETVNYPSMPTQVDLVGNGLTALALAF